MKKKPKQKLFIVRHYVMARDAQHALKLASRQKPDECWIDEEWSKGNRQELASAIGFSIHNEENPTQA